MLSLALGLPGCETRPPPPPRAQPHDVAPPLPSATPARPSALSPPAVVSAAVPNKQPTRLVVHLVPLGAVDAETMRAAAEGLRKHAQVEPIVEDARGLPSQSKSTQPNRYRSEMLLDYLESLALKDGKVMGITETDIVARKGNNPNWGVLGLGSIDGRTCVLSTFRMRRKWENGGASDSVVRDRLWKVALHELGHTLGLEHCPEEGCIMEDGRGTVKTTDRSNALCQRCAEAFESSIRRNLDAAQ